RLRVGRLRACTTAATSSTSNIDATITRRTQYQDRQDPGDDLTATAPRTIAMLSTLFLLLYATRETVHALTAEISPTVSYLLDKGCANDTEIIDHLLFESALYYNKHKLPSPQVDVRIEMWVQEVSSVSELTQDFEIDLYMNEYWTDPGLAYDILNPCQGNLSFDWAVMQNIWTPNTCFINSKKAQLHSSPFTNVFLMVFPNGSVWSNWRIKSTGPCVMDLTKFPMDSIECSLTFESFNYNKDEVFMRWGDPPLTIFKPIELPDFTMTNFSTSNKFQLYAAGYWSELNVNFLFRRRSGWYLLQGYIPTYMTVFISWIPFYLGPKAIPARTMIGVNALLALTFQFGNIIRNLPRVSYIKAIDVWIFFSPPLYSSTSFSTPLQLFITSTPPPPPNFHSFPFSGICFVFASLFELATIGFLMRNEGKPATKSTTRITKNSARWQQPSICKNDNQRKSKNILYCERLDNTSRLMFPENSLIFKITVVFTFYNFIYWFVYMKQAWDQAP
ncbi:LOW QUALITY PROTEIN: Protein CBR-LGC-47, partial [Caenorhabditis briggsae]